MSAAAAIVTAIGVLLTLIATKTFRSSIENLRAWTASRNVSEPVGVVVETEAARVVIDAKGRGKAKPGAEDWSDERWHSELDGRIDSLAAELDRHDHKKTTRSIDNYGPPTKRSEPTSTRSSKTSKETSLPPTSAKSICLSLISTRQTTS